MIAVAWSTDSLEIPQHLRRAVVTIAELDAATHDLNSEQPPPPKPIDCQVGEWGPWSEWEVDEGGKTESRYRERPITQPPAHGGKPCPDTYQQERRLIEEPPVPIATRDQQVDAIAFKNCQAWFKWNPADPVQDCRVRADQIASTFEQVCSRLPSDYEAGVCFAQFATLGGPTQAWYDFIRHYAETRK